MFLGVYIAGSVIRNPRSRPQIITGALLVVVIHKLLSTAVGLGKVWSGLQEAEYVAGRPESMLILEGLGLGIDILMSGVLFGVLPALWPTPALHGKTEPLLRMRPRVPGEPFPGQAPNSGLFVG